MMHVVSHRIWIKCIVYPLTRKMPFFALVFTLRSKVDLILTRAIGPIIAQSVQFSKIVKKLNKDWWQYFSHWKEALFLLKSWNEIWGVNVLLFTAELQKVRTKYIFSDFWERTGASFKMACMWKGEESIKNPFLQNLHRVITVRTQCDKDGA